MNEHDLTAYLTKEQNIQDHLTRKIYGPHAKFEHLSAFGQNTIEKLARERAMVSDPDPELRAAIARSLDLERENADLSTQLSEALRNVEDLWHENEQLKMEAQERDEDPTLRSTRIK